MRGATVNRLQVAQNREVSIHAPRAGCDRKPSGSRASCWASFQFTHPVRGATAIVAYESLVWFVSIHAPRAGCDKSKKVSSTNHKTFQFTHPVRGATQSDPPPPRGARSFNSRTPCGVRPITSSVPACTASFNSRTPCGVRLWSQLDQRRRTLVSIHAPRAGCDVLGAHVADLDCVSIHAPRAGCDPPHAPQGAGGLGFNSRTPCGVRRRPSLSSLRSSKFQFTHPVRGAT